MQAARIYICVSQSESFLWKVHQRKCCGHEMQKKTFLRVLETFRPTAIHTLVWWRLWNLMMNHVNSVDFYSVINSLKGFFYTFENNLVGSQQKEGTFLIDKSWWTWIRLKMLWLKYFLLIWYSNTKILFRLIKLVFGRKNWLKNWKWPNFECPQLTLLQRIK